MSSVDQAVTAETAVAQASAARVENRILGRIAVIVALLSALITFIVLSDFTPISPTHNVVVALLLVSLGTVLLLGAIIGRELWLIVQARRRGRAAARLHVRIIALFSLIAAAPAILVAIVATITLDRALDRLLSTRTQAIVENSVAMADIYLRDQFENLRLQAVTLALDIGGDKQLFEQSRQQFRQRLTVRAANRGLAEAQIIDGNQLVIEKAESRINLPVTLPSPETLAGLVDNEPLINSFLGSNHAAAIIKLPNYENSYLYIAKTFEPGIVARLLQIKENFTEFITLQDRRFGIQIAFALVYAVIALIATLSAVWI